MTSTMTTRRAQRRHDGGWRCRVATVATGLIGFALLAAGCSGTEPDGAADRAREAPAVASTRQALEATPVRDGSRPTAKHPSGAPLRRVIVALRGDFAFEGTSKPEEIKAQRERIRLAQDRIASALGATTGKPSPSATARITQRYETVPGLALELTDDAYAKLKELPDVAQLLEDHLAEPTLAETTGPTLTDARRANLAVHGPRGKGKVVAVLDTGVDRDHPFLGTSRFAASACFSTGGWLGIDGIDEVTLCPGGAERETGGTSGENCSGSVTDCDHGTHVAGIVGGFADSDGNGLLDLGDNAGVAPEVSFVSIQVFHRENRQLLCASKPAPCALSNVSDIIGALDHVETLKTDRGIDLVAANLSLGFGNFTDPQLCNTIGYLAKWAVDDLRSQKIATVAASGNSAVSTSGAFVPGIAAPACISGVVSVGGTQDNDTPRASSQSAPFLSIVAPGSAVVSSVPGTGFASKGGTSMATPHVAGAWALMRERADATGDSDSVDAILSALRSSGRPVADTRLSVAQAFPRLDVLAATRLPVVGITGPSAVQITDTVEVGVTYTLDRHNFTGPLNILPSVQGAAPGDFTLTVDPNPTTASSVVVRIAHALHVTGAFTLHVHAAANGVRVFDQDTALTVDAARPTVTGFSPSSGPVTTPVLIDGSNFSSLTRVIFVGNTSAVEAQAPRVLSPTRLEARVPAGAQRGRIRVQNGINAATSADAFTVTQAPVITAVSPDHAPVGTFVAVTGVNFEPGTNVQLGTTAVSDLTVPSSTRITFRIPAAATGGPLRITTSSGSVSAPFAVGYPVPTLQSFTPQTGHAGQTMTIDGSGYFGDVLVRFGLKAATVTSIGPTRLRVTIPVGVPDSAKVVVRTPGGVVTSAQTFQTDQ